VANLTDWSSQVWPFARDVRFYDVLESTNDGAAEIVKEGSSDLPLLVLAHRQTRGRGRGDHQWWSDRGSLTFTIALDPSAHGLLLESEYKLGLAAAVSVVDALVELDLSEPSLGIRWPNDLEVGGRKFGGILPERVDADSRRALLIGIGINVFTDFTSAPAEVERMATSLARRHPGRMISESFLPTLLFAILRSLECVVVQLAAEDPGLPERWNDLDLLRGRRVKVDLGTRIVEGSGAGIGADGALTVDDGAKRHRVMGGQVIR
jgi:BirA family biotin operon repressor/biotin-[acetyl-CoA-carboxylase] ligase